MQINTEEGEEHHSPQNYISQNHDSEFEPVNQRKVEHPHINPTIFHSNSNSKLQFNKVYPNTISYSIDKTSSSTANIKTGSYDRKNYAPNMNASLSAEKEIMNKTTYDFKRRQNPISTAISYNSKAQIQQKYDNYYRRGDNSAFSYTKRYKNIVSQSSYGKEMVASYNSYFKTDKDLMRPSAYH